MKQSNTESRGRWPVKPIIRRTIQTGSIAAWLVILAAAVGARTGGRSTADLMLQSAKSFIATLNGEERSTAVLDFDGEVREDWHFIPKAERKGLIFRDMDAGQSHLAHALIASGLSGDGFRKATTIMDFEKLVLRADKDGGANSRIMALRDPAMYYVSIFGEPTEGGTWGWSIEGHHVSLNYTIVNGEYVSSTPFFFGAQPQTVDYEGPYKGIRILGPEEDLARALLESASESQRAKIVLGDKAPRDVFSGAKRKVEFEDPAKGLRRSDMTAEQKTMLTALIDEYIANLPGDLAEDRQERVAASGDEIYFAWMGATVNERGLGFYYRVQGKTFLIEFDNVQFNANHSHSVWRDYDGDFGRDILAQHYTASH